MNPEQRRLLALAVAGDRDALGTLLEQFGPAIEHALRIDPRWQGAIDPSDVMQVTYIEAFLRIGGFEVERAAAFPAWLRQVAENNLRDAIRALESQGGGPRQRRVDVGPSDASYVGLLDLLASSVNTPSVSVRHGEAREFLYAALDRLPSDYAQAVRLYDLEGRPIDEVAAALGRSAGAVHMLRLRAHDRLRELLGSPSRILDTRA